MFAVVKLIHCHNEHGSQCPLKFIRCISEFCSIVFLSSVTCEKPPDVENAVHDGDPNIGTYPSGKQLLYTCDYGYYANGEARAMCNGEGQSRVENNSYIRVTTVTMPTEKLEQCVTGRDSG